MGVTLNHEKTSQSHHPVLIPESPVLITESPPVPAKLVSFRGQASAGDGHALYGRGGLFLHWLPEAWQEESPKTSPGPRLEAKEASFLKKVRFDQTGPFKHLG